jgi:hypothetical protein
MALPWSPKPMMGVRFSREVPVDNADVLLGESLAFQANEVGSNPSVRSNLRMVGRVVIA